jgi:hypothetical protein
MSHSYNVARITAAAATGRNKATAADVKVAISRPDGDAWYAENCADAWTENRNSPDLYCTTATACDAVDLTAANIGPNGDTTCHDCVAVADAKEYAFMRENALYM